MSLHLPTASRNSRALRIAPGIALLALLALSTLAACTSTASPVRPRVSPTGIKNVHTRTTACGHFAAQHATTVNADAH